MSPESECPPTDRRVVGYTGGAGYVPVNY